MTTIAVLTLVVAMFALGFNAWSNQKQQTFLKNAIKIQIQCQLRCMRHSVLATNPMKDDDATPLKNEIESKLKELESL